MMNLISRIRELSSPMQPLATDATAYLPHFENIRAVLFDVYGTLIVSGSGDVGVAMKQSGDRAFAAALSVVLPDAKLDAERGLARLYEIIAEHHDRRRKQNVAYPEVDIRDVWSDMLRSALGANPPRDVIERLAVEYECRVNPTWPMPNMVQTLESLRVRGLKLGVVSNAQYFTPLLFEAYAQQPAEAMGFDPALCVYSYEMLEAKPSTALYERAAAALQQHQGIAPCETLYVGNDMLNDVTPAQQVGFRTVFFAGDRRSMRRRVDDERAAGVQPDAVVTALEQLLKLC